MIQVFDPLTADTKDPTVREFHVVTGGHPARFGPDDISQMYCNVPKNFRWGGEVFLKVFRVHVVKMTNAEAARAFSIEISGGQPVARMGHARFRDGRIESNGKGLVADARSS